MDLVESEEESWFAVAERVDGTEVERDEME